MRVNRDELGAYRILLVDDDKTIRDIICQNLRILGFKNFLHASNGVDAFNKLSDCRYEVDLILCDWEMPKGDGLSFLKKIRSTFQSATIPFIMITAQQSRERSKVAEAAFHKVDAYIVKPFNAETLKRKILETLLNPVSEKHGA